MMYDVKIVTDVASETALVSLSDVKAHLYITHSDDDTYLTALIGKCRKTVEKHCNIAIGSQELMWTVDLEAHEEVTIPYQPVISVDNVEVKTDFATYELVTANEDYDVDGQAKKTFTPFAKGRYKIEYTTGYTTVPADLKHAIVCQIAYLYENRGNETKPGLCEMAANLADGYKDYSWT